MMSTKDVMNEMSNIELLRKYINLKIFAKKTEEERFMIVLNILKKNHGFDYWMSKINHSRISKSSEKSEELRQLANRRYISGDDLHRVSQTIELLTKTIAYSPTGSLEMSLAYGNRSAILLKARLYEDALLDIKRALKSGYPDRLKAKLFVRRAMCYKALNERANKNEIEKALENARGWLRRLDRKNPSRELITTILDNPGKMEKLPPARPKWNAERFLQNVFHENPEIVGASEAIAIEYRNKNESIICATRDIKPGEMIAIQEPYAACLDGSRRFTHCWHCFAQTWSGVPCNYCVNIIYCSENCRDTAWTEYHGMLCQIPAIELIMESPTKNFERTVMRMMVKALREAGSLRGLKEMVKKIESNPDKKKKGFTGAVFDGTKLPSVYALPTLAECRTPHTLLEVTYRSIFVVFLMAHRSKFFGEELTLPSFFKHEWMPFVGGLMTRFHLMSMGSLQDGYDHVDSTEVVSSSVGITPLHILMTHSCTPNVSRASFGRKQVTYAHCLIKKGEQIFNCRLQSFEKTTKKRRQKYLTEILGKSCKCVACTENWSTSEVPRFINTKLPIHVVSSYQKLSTIERDLQLAMTGNFAAIAQVLSDLSKAITYWCGYVEQPASELCDLIDMLNRLFLVLGNRRELF